MSDALSLVTGGLFSTSGLSLVTGGLFGIEIDESLHQRTKIRRYVVEKLKAAATDAADRVHSERVDPVQATEYEWALPAINVFTRNETSEEWEKSPRTLRRVVELAVDVICGGK